MEANVYVVQSHYMASSLQFSFSNCECFDKTILEKFWSLPEKNTSNVASSNICMDWKSHLTIHLADLDISSKFLKHLWVILESTFDNGIQEKYYHKLLEHSLWAALIITPGWTAAGGGKYSKMEKANTERRSMKTAVEQQKCLHYMNLALKVWYNIWNVHK